ncbi:hypothetical protein H206_01828, partial [Candidatus Electrothrix aarhusensis]
MDGFGLHADDLPHALGCPPGRRGQQHGTAHSPKQGH